MPKKQRTGAQQSVWATALEFCFQSVLPYLDELHDVMFVCQSWTATLRKLMYPRALTVVGSGKFMKPTLTRQRHLWIVMRVPNIFNEHKERWKLKQATDRRATDGSLKIHHHAGEAPDRKNRSE